MNVPEGVDTVTAEGRDLKMAIGTAAEQLGVQPGQVDYKLDLSHFRSAAGVSMARSTVRIVAWPKPPGSETNGAGEAEAPKRPRRERKPKAVEVDEAPQEAKAEAEAEPAEERRERRPRGRGRRDEERPAKAEGKPESLRGAESGSTEASKFAQDWFEKLLEHMGVEGEVTATGSDDRVHLSVKAERAGRIVGKRGATLGSIRHLLDLALEHRFGKLTIDVDVGDDRPHQEREARGDRDRATATTAATAAGGTGIVATAAIAAATAAAARAASTPRPSSRRSPAGRPRRPSSRARPSRSTSS
ncbi:MAG: KH domain-containing protein [Myxococcota bacterium]